MSSASKKFNVEEEIKDAQRATKLASPLWILFAPIMILSILAELVIAVFLRIWPSKESPDAPGVEGATPVPRKAKYIGDIFGYFNYMGVNRAPEKRPTFAEGPDGDTSSTVWVDNHGYACVSVMDAKSVESLVVDIDHTKHKRTLCPLKFPVEGMLPNFYRNGERSAQFRKLFISYVPKSEHDEQFKTAVDAMKAEAKKWIAAEDGPRQKGDFIMHCINAFSSTLILGEPSLPVELMNEISPLPFAMPCFPRFLPTFLFPKYWGMLKAREHLHKRVKASPRWDKILSKATEVGLTPSEACDTLVPIVGFNALGLRASFGIAIDFLSIPTMNYAEELVKDPKALESFAWEVMRFNGPVAMMPARDEPTIIETSAGAKHAVKKGTILSTLLETTQLDPLVWPEPKSFQADRFLGTDSTTTKVNPWPTLGYAMPLGTIDDKKNYNSHCCVMARLNNRVVEAFIKMLADPNFPRYDLDLKIDEASKKNMYSRKQAETIAFHKK